MSKRKSKAKPEPQFDMELWKLMQLRILHERAVELGMLGGKAAAESMTAEQRKARSKKANKARSKKVSAGERKRIASLAAKARWAKKEKQQ